MADPCTKIKIPTLTHCKDIKSDEKMQKWVVWGLGVTQGHQQHSHSIACIRLSIRLLQKLCVYLVPFSSLIIVRFVESGQF